MTRSRVVRTTLLVVVALIFLIQLVPFRVPPNVDSMEADVFQGTHDAGVISDVLKTSCYDCHSNQSVYPWYAYVAPVSWLVASDVKEGRRELNFSEWRKYSEKRKMKKLEDMAEEVDEGHMPLPIYLNMHPDATLNKEQRQIIVQWSRQMREQLSSTPE